MAVLIVRDSANPIEVVGGAIIIAGILISRRGRVRIAVP
jgi:drug/metabolite transporter (DMT)-like permease